jgi:hypothetical protein
MGEGIGKPEFRSKKLKTLLFVILSPSKDALKTPFSLKYEQ